MSPSEPISLSQAAKALGLSGRHAGRRLRRHLLRVEREQGRTIMQRVGDGSKRTHLRVTLHALRRHCPDLFDPVERLDAELRRSVHQIHRRIDTVDDRVDEAEAKIAALAGELSSKRS